MPAPKITLYVDVVSPFSYLGFYALRHWPIFKQCEITYVPILLGGLMKMCNNRAPIEIKNKGKWINIERQRWATLFNVPIGETSPEPFPQSTLGCQRALTALTLSSNADRLPDALDALYATFWQNHKPIAKPETVIEALAKVIGEQDAKSVFENGSAPEVKKLLVERTDEAFAEGAFGLPWFVATNSKGDKQGFWGFDHIGQVCDHLGLERPQSGGWRALL